MPLPANLAEQLTPMDSEDTYQRYIAQQQQQQAMPTDPAVYIPLRSDTQLQVAPYQQPQLLPIDAAIQGQSPQQYMQQQVSDSYEKLIRMDDATQRQYLKDVTSVKPKQQAAMVAQSRGDAPLVPIDANEAYQRYQQQQQQQQATPTGTQQGTQPDVQQQQREPDANAAPSADMLASLNQDAQRSAQAFTAHKQTQQAQANMDNVIKHTQGWMPHVLAIGAALKGDFRPAIALQQQKEQTAIGKAMIPVLANIQELTSNGKLEDAYAAAEQAAAQAGDRAPEVSKILQGSVANISRRMQDWANTRHVAEMGMKVVKAEAQKNNTDPKDDPRYNQFDMLLHMSDPKEGRTGFDSATLNNIMVAARTKHQRVGGVDTFSSEGSTQLQERPATHYTQPSDLRNYVGYELGAKYKLTADQIANVLAGKPEKTATGEVVQPGSATAQQIHDDFVTIQPVLGQIEVGKNIPLTPEANLQLLESGQDPLAVATKVFGNKGKQVLDTAQQLMEARQSRLAAIPIRVGLQENPVLLKNAGYVNVNIDPTHPDYLTESKVPMTYNEVLATQGKMQPVRTEILDKEIRPAQRAIQGMQYITKLFSSIGNPSTPYDRIVAGINRYASDFLQIDTTGEMGVTKAAQAIVNNSIEALEKTELLPKAEIGVLKGLVTGQFASEPSAIKAVNTIMERMNQFITRAIGVKAAKPGDLPDNVKNEEIRVAPNAPQVPNAVQTPAAGSGPQVQPPRRPQSGANTAPIQVSPGVYSTTPPAVGAPQTQPQQGAPVPGLKKGTGR